MTGLVLVAGTKGSCAVALLQTVHVGMSALLVTPITVHVLLLTYRLFNCHLNLLSSKMCLNVILVRLRYLLSLRESNLIDDFCP
jgi:hypothetical protein